MVNGHRRELVINIYKVFFLLLREFILEDLKTFVMDPAVEVPVPVLTNIFL